MFTQLLQFFSRTPAQVYERGFVQEVNVTHRRPPNPRMQRFILICWLLIAIKHVAVIYACSRWPVPFHQLWINAPTFALGLLATTVYWRRA
ncbi:MAG: hypothetical protein KA257_07155 [Opitutaceae bacterium]|nr:hypothetical protein [Opitutaceae bacterium]MBP9912585.1 hypothetical protein [Opitutaceae bacterium]